MSRSRLHRHVARLAAPVLAVGFLTGVGPGSVGASTCSAWTGGPQPADVSGETINTLTGVAVISPCNAWAVGWASGSKGYLTLIYHWNGTAWFRAASPSPSGSAYTNLRGVAAVSSTNIWAVGFYEVSGIDRTMILHYNGTSWSQVPNTPNPGGTSQYNDLYAVWATSANDVWAVGEYGTGTSPGRTLILHYNGTAWSHVSSPNIGATNAENGLLSVTATASNNAWAVGTYYNGTTHQTLILRWNGTSWLHITSPNPGGSTVSNELQGVAATATNNAWAVGYYDVTGGQRTLTMRWNGTSWTTVTSPNPGGTTHANQLNAVTAISPTNFWAVGDYGNGTSERTLAMQWNGSSWSTTATPNLGAATANNGLNAVDASSASNLWVVGGYYDGTTHNLALHCC